MIKMSIQVRNADGTVLETIKRKPWAEQFGNFNPVFCRYKGKKCLVQSDKGDISDPFRADESYLETMYIMPRDESGKIVDTWAHTVTETEAKR